MTDNDSETGSTPRGPAEPAAEPPHRPSRRRTWLLLAGLALLASGGALAALWPGPAKQPPAAAPLNGQLAVVVRPPEQREEARSVEEPGAVPVRAGGIMSL